MNLIVEMEEAWQTGKKLRLLGIHGEGDPNLRCNFALFMLLKLNEATLSGHFASDVSRLPREG